MQVPKFQLIGKTLTVRLDNRWPSAGLHSIQKMPNTGKLTVYPEHTVEQVLVICSLYEPTRFRQPFFSEFADSLHSHNPELAAIPLHYLVHSDAEPVNNTSEHTVTVIDSFELTTKLIYDLSVHKHGNTPWHPYTQRVLFLPGKLRPARFTVLQELMREFPTELVYTLNRRLVCNVGPMSTEQQQLNWWITDIKKMYSNDRHTGISAEEVVEFALAHETEIMDTDLLRMHDHTQMFSQAQLETTSLSAIVETVPWKNTQFYTEKTYAPIAAGRPFVHYHGVDDYLEHRGYQLYCDSEPGTQTEFTRQFLHEPDVHTAQATIQHNLHTLQRNCEHTVNSIVSVFPEYADLTAQQQIDVLITFRTIEHDTVGAV